MADAMPVRYIEPAEFAASRLWIGKWQRVLPCLIATRGLISGSLVDDITLFVSHPQSPAHNRTRVFYGRFHAGSCGRVAQ